MSVVELMCLPPGSSRRTFSEDERLPPLPLPPLSHTLRRYVDSVRPFVSAPELANTEQIVSNFERGIGRVLQEKLQAKAKTDRNWVEKWWEDKAYLENRLPLVPFGSMNGISPVEDFWNFAPGRMVKYASLYMYYTIQMWELLRSELLAPTQSADGKIIFSMQQFRRLFNCSRIPLPQRDLMDVHFRTAKEGPCPSHVVVMCNGHIFYVDAIDEATGTALTPPEWERQLQSILDEAYVSPGPGLGCLTCDDRDTWAKNYERLKRISGENARFLHNIESAICVLTLEPNIYPNSASEVTMSAVAGDYKNVWADKSLQVTFFGNGRSGGLADHTAFDGMISVTNSFYTYQSLLETNGEWTGSMSVRSLSRPCLYNFILDSAFTKELEQALLRQSVSKRKVIIIREKFTGFGKTFPVKNGIHPDTFIQMALQLTYYSIHKRFAPCYETATTRAYFNGRTETLRSCTEEVTNWAKAMLRSDMQVSEKVQLLQIAAKKHDNLMKEARENSGCDRHLFGLYCISEENQIPVPELFMDPSFIKSGGAGNFILSTSLVGYTPVGGGVAPMSLDGYGIFYNICPDSFSFTISVMRDSAETSAIKFFRRLSEIFHLMKNVVETAKATSISKPKSHL